MNAKGTSSGENSTKEKPVDKPRRLRDDKRDRKKDDKSVEHVLKALNSLDTTEEKLAAMCKNYADILNDHRMLQNAAKQAEKRCCLLQREIEQLQADHSKAILTRSRLENLCRELQRQNKAVKEESMMRIREEEEKRKEVSTKFQTTLSEITTMMQQNNDKNTKLRDDNIDMTAKLKNVCEQYEKREQHVEKLAKQMQLEVQLADAKLAKAKMEMAVEKETWLHEKQQLLLEKAEYKARLEEMRGTELSLRDQITLYNNKYDEFHRALTQSNEAIGGFKTEMERMSKQIRKLEKETGSWRTRYEHTHTSLLKMTEEKLVSDQELATTNRKLAALQNLCRTLQGQCVQLRTELRQVKGGEADSSTVSCPAASTQVDEIKGPESEGKNTCPSFKKDEEKEVLSCEKNEKEIVGNIKVTADGEIPNNGNSEVVSLEKDNCPKPLEKEVIDNTPVSLSKEEPVDNPPNSLVKEKPLDSGEESIINAAIPVGDQKPKSVEELVNNTPKLLVEEKPVDDLSKTLEIKEAADNSQPVMPGDVSDAPKSVCENGNIITPDEVPTQNDIKNNSSSAELIMPAVVVDNSKPLVNEEAKNSTTSSLSASENVAQIPCTNVVVNEEKNVCQEVQKDAPSEVLALPVEKPEESVETKPNECQTNNPNEITKEAKVPPQVQTTNNIPSGKEKANSSNKQSGKKKNKNNKCQ